MEPITLCGAVIVAFGLWVEFEAIIMKVVSAISKSALMTALMSSTQEQKSGRLLSPQDYRGYGVGSDLPYKPIRRLNYSPPY